MVIIRLSFILRFILLFFAILFTFINIVIQSSPEKSFLFNPPVLYLWFFTPFFLSSFYKIVITEDQLFYQSPFKKWKIDIKDIIAVRTQGGKGASCLKLIMRKGENRTFGTNFFDRDLIWSSIRIPLQALCTEKRLPAKLYGGCVEIN